MAQTQISTHETKATGPVARTAGAEQELRDRLGVAPAPARSRPEKLRGRIIEGLKTLMWVAPLTILLWVYAERSQLDKGENISASIQVKSTDPAHRIVTTDVKSLSLDLAGPRASIERVRDYLSNPSVRLDVLVPEEPFEGDISVAERLATNDIFAREAVTVTKTRPATIRVKVERRETRTLPVRARKEDNIFGEITFTPDVVTVSGPSWILTLSPDQQFVDAIMSSFRDRKPGVYPAETVQLSVPFLNENVENVTISPQTVLAKVEIKPSEVYSIPSIPVYLDIPAGVFEEDKFTKIQCKLVLTNVEVTGPKEAIKELKENTFLPRVVVHLEPSDFTAQGDKLKTLRDEDYVMPKGVTVMNAKQTLTIKLDPR